MHETFRLYLFFSPLTLPLLFFTQAQLLVDLPVGVEIRALEIHEHLPSPVEQHHVPSLVGMVLSVLLGEMLVKCIDPNRQGSNCGCVFFPSFEATETEVWGSIRAGFGVSLVQNESRYIHGKCTVKACQEVHTFIFSSRAKTKPVSGRCNNSLHCVVFWSVGVATQYPPLKFLRPTANPCCAVCALP